MNSHKSLLVNVDARTITRVNTEKLKNKKN